MNCPNPACPCPTREGKCQSWAACQEAVYGREWWLGKRYPLAGLSPAARIEAVMELYAPSDGRPQMISKDQVAKLLDFPSLDEHVAFQDAIAIYGDPTRPDAAYAAGWRKWHEQETR